MKSTKLLMGLLSAIILVGCATTGGGSASVDDETRAKKDFRMQQSDKGTALIFSDRLLFETGKSQLREESSDLMQKVSSLVVEKDIKKIEIGGHTDDQGSPQFNQRLSEERAVAVKAALIARGVKAERVSTKGYGLNQPVAPNTTAEGRQANRRAEVLLLGAKKEDLGGQKLESGFLNSAGKALASIGEFAKEKFDALKKAFQ